MKIDFVLLGNPKCGSTYLYDLLGKCEEIGLPVQKEPGLFYSSSNREYLKKFKLNFGNEEGIKCDFSVGYSIDVDALNRIFSRNSQTKVMLLLRNPVDRTYSHFWHKIKMDELDSSIDLLKLPRDHEIFLFSNYVQQVENIYKIFPRENVLISTLPRLKTKAGVKEIADFLSVSLEHISNVEPKNSAKIYRSQAMNRFINFVRQNTDFSKLLPRGVYVLARSCWTRMKDLNLVDFTYPSLDSETKGELEKVLEDSINYYNSINHGKI